MMVSHNLWACELMAKACKRNHLGRSDSNPSIQLYSHTLPDGRVFTEFVQGVASVRSGVLIFVAFKDEQGNVVKESLWKESSMKSEV
ncbi:MAG: hypothetical protein A2915_00750 [Candidatus Yanofskybacteria bacterium RIFCSPLOWO2_01_FULL_41_34]|uniref:Uncharacterized protein n=1 Tax=Candidatus Yanofskybacteria bacterium RIFCSPHIGHO2_01_FULL_41_26 TaxID=1802661 RepID=A0A1F8EC81_9BACT|nr:MAG: hypothetical protein A2649_02780 [Candidatus Yanofskybacteria bacterium RIFCSPHIGHO2_01_FULL_41_26]OGN22424.1 MAG: hypothetical protein A2915_00750 [Candidatus Yanofskybacteria bacterium RIFCSPLOWO2_01_FULL_41_34]